MRPELPCKSVNYFKRLAQGTRAFAADNDNSLCGADFDLERHVWQLGESLQRIKATRVQTHSCRGI